MATIVKLHVDNEGTKSLNDYLTKNELNAKERFHSTIFYSHQNPVFQEKSKLDLTSKLPITIEPPLTVEVFGDNLVLRYENEQVKRLNEELIADAVRQVIHYPDLSKEELEVLRDYIIVEVERTSSRERLNLSNRKTGLVAYTEFNPHISIAKGHQRTLKLATFDKPITFDSFSWKVE